MRLIRLAERYAASAEFRTLLDARASGARSLEGIAPSSFPLVIAALHHHAPTQILVIAKNYQRMEELAGDCASFLDERRVCTFPPWETLPYEFVSPSESIERERITTIYRIMRGDPVVVIATVESLMRAIPAQSFFTKKGITLTIGEDYPFEDILAALVEYGYRREQRVEAFGQFAVKGGILDIFLPSEANPVRLDFFGDTLESIREFDIDSQVSLDEVEEITVYPRREIILSKAEREALDGKIREAAGRGLETPVIDDADGLPVDGAHAVEGIEELFPLAIDASTIDAFLRPDAEFVIADTLETMSQRDSLMRSFAELYERRNAHALCLPPETLLQTDAFDAVRARALALNTFSTGIDAVSARLRSVTSFQGKIKTVRGELAERIENGWRAVICTAFEGQARRLYDLFADLSPSGDFEAIDDASPLNIVITPLREGVEIVDDRTIVITDHEIFGKTYKRKSQFKKKKSRPIDSFLDLREGDYVVHINHGIGIFKGLERMTASGVERDFLLIEYAEGDKLYVTLDQITMVQRYVGLEGKPPRVDLLGKKSAWNRIKEKVQKAIEELANDLIQIYSQRMALKGFPFPPDTQWQEEFESKFEYEETPDQITAIEDVKDDMESPRPMDRLVCGDVGFGKTEVAIRAAFKSVMAGKQVAVLVPTTVLAMQHFNTFTKRFADYPISVDMISRFRSASEAGDIKRRLTEGALDIVIGTHALLGADVAFKNLGLLVVDEEQRFGVKHKERLKKLRSLVDVLTLSATPIPRTLHMAVAGIRDLTIIATPPENRQAIDTYVIEENPDIVRDAILREIGRGGQVFYVHNRVETITAQKNILETLVPEATFCVAHGQMEEHELERVIIDFLDNRFDVLVSTTIIESGLDMPHVNTIIINRADTFGLSQLYQLKGRVGRSAAKAYAYLFYPRHASLSEIAQKRLQVISEYAELGSGFKIAMKDLEIRGSGNILGREQSGNIMDVGFDLYCQMLEDAVRKMKGQKPVRIYRTPVFINTTFFIPETYMADERQKIEFYKKFESCETLEEVAAVEREMMDRFGRPPAEVRTLIDLEEIRTIASALEIDEILEESRAIKITISEAARADRQKLVESITSDERLTIDPRNPDVLHLDLSDMSVEKKLAHLKKWLQQIS